MILVINVSGIKQYIDQVDGQRKEALQPVIIEGEEEWEVEKILNKRKVRGKNRFLVWWKGFIVEGDTWESRKNLENAKDLLKEFKEEYKRDNWRVRKQEENEEEGDYWRGTMLEWYMVRRLFGWLDSEYNCQYWQRLERNWRQWKDINQKVRWERDWL